MDFERIDHLVNPQAHDECHPQGNPNENNVCQHLNQPLLSTRQFQQKHA
jgi:hypothetical protein